MCGSQNDDEKKNKRSFWSWGRRARNESSAKQTVEQQSEPEIIESGLIYSHSSTEVVPDNTVEYQQNADDYTTPEEIKKKPSFFTRLYQGLGKTRNVLVDGVAELFIGKKPIFTAEYPLFSLVYTSSTLPFSTLITVTGTDWPVVKNSLVIPIFVPNNPKLIIYIYIFISMSTPEAKSNFMSASTVCGVGSIISISLLCVLCSN